MKIPGKKLLAKGLKWLVEQIGDELEEEFDKAREKSVAGADRTDAPRIPRHPR
jgi:hypothetical protein